MPDGIALVWSVMGRAVRARTEAGALTCTPARSMRNPYRANPTTVAHAALSRHQLIIRHPGVRWCYAARADQEVAISESC